MSKFILQALLASQVVDPIMTVMAQEDAKIMEKVANLGTWSGTSDTYAGLPTVDLAGKAIGAGDLATLTATDGDNKAGLYRFDGTNWLLEIDYSNLNLDNIIASIQSSANATTVDADGNVVASEGDKFATSQQMADAINGALTAQATANGMLYHPKGGDENLKVVGKDADENTQEFVTANQLNATFTLAEIQAKYDAI